MTTSTHTQRYKKFCQLLAEARIKKGLTQTQVAAKLGKPQSYVSKYESGERRLDVVEFLDVAKALKIEIKKLFQNLPNEFVFLDKPKN